MKILNNISIKIDVYSGNRDCRVNRKNLLNDLVVNVKINTYLSQFPY